MLPILYDRLTGFLPDHAVFNCPIFTTATERLRDGTSRNSCSISPSGLAGSRVSSSSRLPRTRTHSLV
jgi:hypothetical protein